MTDYPIIEDIHDVNLYLIKHQLYDRFINNNNEKEFESWLGILNRDRPPLEMILSLRECWLIYYEHYLPSFFWRLFGWKNLNKPRWLLRRHEEKSHAKCF